MNLRNRIEDKRGSARMRAYFCRLSQVAIQRLRLVFKVLVLSNIKKLSLSDVRGFSLQLSALTA